MTALIEPAFFDRQQAINNDGYFISAIIPYFVFGVADETDALEYAHANIPTEFEGMARKNIEIAERMAEDVFKVSANYQATYTGDNVSYTYSTLGGSQRVTQALATIFKFPGTAEDMQGSIGWDGERAEGTDIVVPVINFTETHTWPDALVSQRFYADLAKKVGTVNDWVWKTHDPGDVLFLGFSVNKPASDEIGYTEVTYNFAISPTRTNFYVGDILVTIKRGWEYMDIHYEKIVSSTKLLPKPIAVYILKVYEYSDFNDIIWGEDD